MDFEMSIKVTRSNIERGRGGVESKQGFDFFATGCFNAKVRFSG